MTSMLTANEIVKEQIVQTTSKKVLRSSERQKLRACKPPTPYVGIGSFVQATACLLSRKVNYSTVSAASFNQNWIDSIGFNFFARIVFV